KTSLARCLSNRRYEAKLPPPSPASLKAMLSRVKTSFAGAFAIELPRAGQQHFYDRFPVLPASKWNMCKHLNEFP
ncbi:MAG: hypothetical protein AAGA30_08230, partial [Planctomycetota bacterium]